MTEAKWLAALAGGTILEMMQGRASQRKLRLFACACCRLTWDKLADGRSRRAVEAAERHADGAASDDELDRAGEEAYCVLRDTYYSTTPSEWSAAQVVPNVAAARAMVATTLQPTAAEWGAFCAAKATFYTGDDERARMAAGRAGFGLWLDVAGSGVTCRIDGEWRRRPGWVPELARAAYEERRLPDGTLDPARLGLLADALEDAGCDRPDLLAHLRSPGPHVRGCWAVDLLTGKE